MLLAPWIFSSEQSVFLHVCSVQAKSVRVLIPSSRIDITRTAAIFAQIVCIAVFVVIVIAVGQQRRVDPSRR